ncbi:membrane protein [Paractinoplanes deccanensis]|uniref:Membrane protein n=1 Tax=Paractinoplanes deccanensis TaxID=113561 RepID=A0ABQ3YH21_9ACTN|nr:membrane protein [Actinoplanes deccanensis]
MSPWAAWVVFAGVMLSIVGILQVTIGIVALVRDDLFAVDASRLLVAPSWTAWGWIHLVIGAAQIVVGLGLLAGTSWGRIFGVVLAFLNSLTNLAFLAAFPVWTALIISFNMITIYAITAHGTEVRPDYD